MAANDAQLVRNLVSTARQAINAMDPLDTDDSADAFQNVVSIVRNNFSRPPSGRTSEDQGRHRGRKKRIEWMARLFLLRRNNPDFLPSPAECRYLTRHGFGEATSENSNKICLLRTWAMPSLEQKIYTLFPRVPLQLVGFRFARCDKRKKIHLVEPMSVADLERKVGRGKIILVPNRDIPMIEGQPDQEDQVDSQRPAQMDILDPQPPTQIDLLDQQPPAQIDLLDQQPPAQIDPVDQQPPGGEYQQPLAQQTEDQQEPMPLVTGWIPTGTPSVMFRANGDNAETVPVEVDAHLQNALTSLENTIGPEETLFIKRDDICETLLELYKDDAIVEKRLHVSFLNEEGDDFGGLTKDLFTSFWAEAFKIFFIGEDVKVPSLPLHRVRKEAWMFRSMGSILTHSVALTRHLPSMLARTAIIAIIFESDVDSECLLEDFFHFCTMSERILLQKALTQFSQLSGEDLSNLISFFQTNRYFELPKANEIRDQILDIATEQLINVPKSLYATMRRGIPQNHLQVFWGQLTISEISMLFKAQRPTPEKVAKCIVATDDDIRAEEDRVLYFLKQFVSILDQDDLVDFLYFVTGSIHMPQDGIKVSFTTSEGLMRRPIAHTCSNLIELSVMYSSFQEFKREMRQYLRSDFSYQFLSYEHSCQIIVQKCSK